MVFEREYGNSILVVIAKYFFILISLWDYDIEK